MYVAVYVAVYLCMNGCMDACMRVCGYKIRHKAPTVAESQAQCRHRSECDYGCVTVIVKTGGGIVQYRLGNDGWVARLAAHWKN